MKRKRTLHSWFASNSNTPTAVVAVPESNNAPIDVVVQLAQVESTNPSNDVDESQPVDESIIPLLQMRIPIPQLMIALSCPQMRVPFPQLTRAQISQDIVY